MRGRKGPDRVISVPVERSMVGLLDIDPDFERLLSLEDRVIAQRLSLPVHEVPAGPRGADVNALLAEAQAFGAFVVELDFRDLRRPVMLTVTGVV
jgi:hypothetical protein